MRSTLLVFDLDGTLVTTRAGRRAFNLALERVFGVPDAAAGVPMAGRTDPHIFRDVCDTHGIDPGTFTTWKARFVTALAEALEEDPGYIHPGVEALLEVLNEDGRFRLALGTGNVEEGARLKLTPHNLNRYFPVGGFGDDGATRDEVIAVAMKRAEAHYGRRFDQVAVIGDTPFDILCGKANGCYTVGVATGYHKIDELSACGADLVLPDFRDLKSVLTKLRNL